MKKIECEGIVLRSVDYLKNQKILTLFTREQGLISLLVHGVNGRNLTKFNLCSPLSRGQFQTEKGASDFYLYRDGSLLDLHLFLRENWRALQCACSFVHALLESQLFEKPAPLLYELLLSYLGALKECENHMSLKASFRLKILKHEGLLSYHNPLFLESEQRAMASLSTVRHFREIETIEVSLDLEEKISHFFSEAIG